MVHKDITSDERRKIEAVTSQYGLRQEINEPTHILNNSTSCIDLIFNSQPNLLIESGVHPSLHPNCHHQIVLQNFEVMKTISSLMHHLQLIKSIFFRLIYENVCSGM